jgi:hypothetical protein
MLVEVPPPACTVFDDDVVVVVVVVVLLSLLGFCAFVTLKLVVAISNEIDSAATTATNAYEFIVIGSGELII